METPYTLTAAITETTAAKPQQGRRALTFLVVFLLVQTLFGQAGGQTNPNPDQLLIYGILMRAHAGDEFEKHIAAGGNKTDAVHGKNKQDTGLTDAQLGILVRYGNQFFTAFTQMTAARSAAFAAKDSNAAHFTEAAFHTTWAAQIKALKDELGPGA